MTKGYSPNIDLDNAHIVFKMFQIQIMLIVQSKAPHQPVHTGGGDDILECKSNDKHIYSSAPYSKVTKLFIK